MAASRDDFVIAIRSAFLKKSNKQRFSLIVLILFSVGLIFLSSLNFKAINYVKIGLNEIVYRISFIASLPEQQFQKSIVTVNEHFKMYKQYQKIKEKLNTIESNQFNNQFIISENKRLRNLIDEYIVTSNELVAKVLLDKNSPFLRSVIINKGSKDNIKIGMAVLDNQYLVGKIVEVNYASSRALLISDLNSKIPVNIEPGYIQSILSGTGKDLGELQYFREKKIFDENSVVYTSGSGNIFKAGIPIGKIYKDQTDDKIKVKFFSDLSQLTFVKIVSFEKEKK